MLSTAYFLAKFPFDTAENEPAKNVQHLNFCSRKFFGGGDLLAPGRDLPRGDEEPARERLVGLEVRQGRAWAV